MSDSSSFCVMSSSIWQFIGYLLFALKIMVPLIIIILGVVDFVKAVTSSKDEAITSAAKNLGLRIMIGLIIFFVPLIISTIFKFVKEANSYVAAADACQRCLLRPFTSECEGYKAVAKEEREKQKGKLDEVGGQKVEAVHCYFVYNDGDTNGKYVWGIEKTKGYDHVTLERKYYSAASCTSSLNSTKVLNYTTKPNEEENPSSGGGNGSDSNSDVIYVGDSQINGLCSNNGLTNCYSCVGGGLDWLNGSISRCSNTGASSSVIKDVAKKIASGTKIVINLGTNDMAGNERLSRNAATDLVNKYKNLLANEWSGASKIIVTSINPINPYHSLFTYNITENNVNWFNNQTNLDISDYKNAKLVFCNLGFKRDDFISDNNYADGLHFTADGYKKINDAINKKCLNQ